jgi:hypothetical protein
MTIIYYVFCSQAIPNHPPQFSIGGASGVGTSTDEEDTMKNLRKTFAGIFGDM